ncbi:MAG: N-acetylmuramoyl-L-alanine amidase [Verrucomicrobia bacterium]|nr:N-acetylmuramoyl-L-alanine amidase [Verrucomicrobiota bacterium]
MNASSRIHRLLALLSLLLATASVSAFETVVIDPGHGGNDEGTEWRKVTEKDLTLAIARRLEKILREKHIQTVLTRHCDAFISLDERAEIANLFPDSLLLSIHFNGARMFDVNGFEIYAFRHSPTSRTIAESIQQAMMENLRSKNRGLRTDQDYAVLVRSAGSAVLVECGFISNKAEASRLTSPEGQEALAEAIALGVMRIKPLINTDPPEADIAKCEIHARKHDEAMKAKEGPEKKSAPPKKVVSSGSKPKSKQRKK